MKLLIIQTIEDIVNNITIAEMEKYINRQLSDNDLYCILKSRGVFE